MQIRSIMSVMAVTALAGYASAQSAQVSMSAGSATAAPGDTISVTVACDYDTLGAPGGAFGTAGFYGFGGDIGLSGPSAGDVTASSGVIAPALTFGPMVDLAGGPELVRAAAGRGFLGGLADDPATMFTFDVTIDPGAADGTFTLEYDGAIVLVLGDSLGTFSTSPGLNQSSLGVTPLVITVSSSTCIADVTTTGAGVGDPGYGVPDGQVTGADIQFYVNAWISFDLGVADVTTTGAGLGDPGYGVPDGQVTGADIQFYVNAWVAGCP